MKSDFVQYFVEGEDEEKLLRVLKTDMGLLRPGKVQKLNVVECELATARLMTLRKGTMVVLVFDTDTGQIDILNRNLKKLKQCSAVSEIVTIPQVPNLEEELIRSCAIKNVKELLSSKSQREFKTDLIREKNLADKLRKRQFNIREFWSVQPPAPYQGISNQAEKVKLRPE